MNLLTNINGVLPNNGKAVCNTPTNNIVNKNEDKVKEIIEAYSNNKITLENAKKALVNCGVESFVNSGNSTIFVLNGKRYSLPLNLQNSSYTVQASDILPTINNNTITKDSRKNIDGGYTIFYKTLYKGKTTVIKEETYSKNSVLKEKVIYSEGANGYYKSSITQYDEKKNIIGEIEYYANGNKKAEAEYWSGALMSKSYYYENQKNVLAKKDTYNNNKINKTQEYDKNGKLTKETFYDNTKVTSTKTYSYSGTTTYITVRDSQNKITEKITITNDKKTTEQYDKNGKLYKVSVEKNTSKGKELTETEYLEDGGKKITLTIGTKIQSITWFDKNGKKTREAVRQKDGKTFKTTLYDKNGKAIKESSKPEGWNQVAFDLIGLLQDSKLLLDAAISLSGKGGDLTADFLYVSANPEKRTPEGATRKSFNDLTPAEKKHWQETILKSYPDTTDLGYRAEDLTYFNFDEKSKLSKEIKSDNNFKNAVFKLLNNDPKAKNSVSLNSSDDLANSIGGIHIDEVLQNPDGSVTVKYSDVYDFNQNIGKNEPGGMSEVGAILQRQGHLKPFVITGTVKFTKAEWESYVKSLK